METSTKRGRAIALSRGNSENPKARRILRSFLSTANTSCIQDCNVIVYFIWVSMEFHISSSFLALFSNICLFLVFHISQIVKPRKSSHSRFTILFLKLLRGHSTIVISGLPLCLLSLLKIDVPFSHKELAILHSSSRIRRFMTSQQKTDILGHHPPFQI